MQIVAVKDATTGATVGSKIAMAETSWSRLIGLLGKRRLDAGCGLWIRPSSGVHTFGMSFSIDVVTLDKSNKVLRTWRNMRPFRMTSIHLKTHSILELPAGQIDLCGISPGDQMEVV